VLGTIADRTGASTLVAGFLAGMVLQRLRQPDRLERISKTDGYEYRAPDGMTAGTRVVQCRTSSIAKARRTAERPASCGSCVRLGS